MRYDYAHRLIVTRCEKKNIQKSISTRFFFVILVYFIETFTTKYNGHYLSIKKFLSFNLYQKEKNINLISQSVCVCVVCLPLLQQFIFKKRKAGKKKKKKCRKL